MYNSLCSPIYGLPIQVIFPTQTTDLTDLPSNSWPVAVTQRPSVINYAPYDV